MIRVKICNPNDFSFDKGSKIYKFEDNTNIPFNFYADAAYQDADANFKPFRDKYSVDYLKLYNYYFEDDTYSIVTPIGKHSIFTLSKGVKYVLTLMKTSQSNIYLSYVPLGFTDWKYLGSLPFDILLAVTKEELSNFSTLEYVEYVIENFSYNDSIIELNITDNLGSDLERIDLTDKFNIYKSSADIYKLAGKTPKL